MTDRPFTMADLNAAIEMLKQRGAFPPPNSGLILGDPIAGVRVVTSHFLTETVPYPRSPARARRRAAMGHRQHYRVIPSTTAYRLQDGSLVMHPARYAEIKARIAAVDAARDKAASDP